MQFLWVEFQAENVIKAWPTSNGMNLLVSDLVLQGLPPDLDLNNKLRFELKGQLKVHHFEDHTSQLPNACTRSRVFSEAQKPHFSLVEPKGREACASRWQG